MSLEFHIKREAILLKKIYNFSKEIMVPDYIYIGNNPPKSFVPVDKVDNKVIAISTKNINKKLTNFAVTLFIWEAAIILALILVFYKTVIKYIKEEENIKQFLELTLLTITHKLGNFLSIYRVNIEILKDKCNSKALNRLDNAYKIMEKDFVFTTNSLKRLSFQEKNIKRINLKIKIMEILSFFGQALSDKHLTIHLKDVYVKIDEQDLENILFSIFENIAKYAYKSVHIKICTDKNHIFLIVRNDFKSISKGSGIGMKLAEFLISQYGGEIRTRAKKSFLTLLIFSK